MNFKDQYIYSKRLNCTAVAHAKSTKNRVCVHYPTRHTGTYGQIVIGRNNVWITESQFNLINTAMQKRALKRKNQAAKDIIEKADKLIAKL